MCKTLIKSDIHNYSAMLENLSFNKIKFKLYII